MYQDLCAIKVVGSDVDRQDVLAFLAARSEYAPASGEVVGMLKQMHDEMSADQTDADAKEKVKVKSYEALTAGETKEVNALSKMIEEKLERAGGLVMEIQEMKNDLGEIVEGLGEDKQFLADWGKG